MRSATALVMVISACGPSNPLDGKEWTPTLRLGDLSDGSAVDGEERLVTSGFNDRHTFRLDPGTALWDDLGVSAENSRGTLRTDRDGVVYQDYITPDFNDRPRRRLYRLDDRTWTRIAAFDAELTVELAADGTWWGYEWTGSAPVTTTLYKLVDGTWTPHAMFADHELGFLSDSRGQLYAFDEKRKGLWKVNAAGGLDVVLDCGTIIDPACGNRFLGFRVDGGGNIFFFGGDPGVGHAMYRLPAGGTKAELFTRFPEIDVDAPHVFGFQYDGDGNFYLVYGNNVSSAADLFFLEDGSTEWQDVIDWPRGNTTYFPLVGRKGTVYAVNAAGPHMVLK